MTLRLKLGATAAGTLTVAGALVLAQGIGPFLAIGLLVIAAFLFGNWYRTSTPRAKFETEPVIADAEQFGSFSLHWTAEGADTHGKVLPQASATAR